jgi:hypothetical protein
MNTLYLLRLPSGPGPAHGVMWQGNPDHPGDPDHGSELVGLDLDMDDWNGSELVGAIDPWFLASSAVCEAIAAAGLSGLLPGMVANTFYSPRAAVLASLGELASKEIPEFRIVRPEAAIEVSRLDGSTESIGVDDDLRYTGWNGDDFTRNIWGPVLSSRALEVVQQHRLDGCAFWPVHPRQA